MSAWTDELKAAVVKAYQDGKPTPDNSIELVKQIAEDFEQTPNGVRMVLSQAKVYLKKDASASSATKAADGDKPKRVSKEDSIAALRGAITTLGKNVDDEILTKLTGKAAVYFLSLLQEGEDE